MLELMIILLAIIAGLAFFRSQAEMGPDGITFKPHPNTPEGRRKRTLGLLTVALIMSVIIFAHARSEYLSLRAFGLIALSALVVFLVFFKRTKNK